MATVDSVKLSAATQPGYIHANNVSQESADKVSQLLLENHNKFHVFFDYRELHNHCLHHLLVIYALGATPADLQAAWDRNMTYQVPRVFPKPRNFEYDLSNTDVFLKCMTKPAYYIHFLNFFKREIASKGMGEVMKEYVFKGDERANRILTRLYDGVLHGLIHVGYAFEFEQPLILAEALAEAAITTEYLDRIIEGVVAYRKNNKTVPDSNLMSIYPRLRTDPTIFHAVRSTDGPNKLRDGLIARAKQNMIPYLAEFSVKPHQIKRKTAELANTGLFVAAAAQRPEKVEMIDFFLLHSVNSSIWMSVLSEQTWMTDEIKCRLIEIKGWSDLITYACCKVPALYPERIFNYTPKRLGNWESVYRRAVVYNDDGHVPKFIRAARYVEQVSQEYAGQPEFPLRAELCLTIAHMAMDSVDRQNEPGYRLPGEAKFYEMADMEVQRLVFRFVRFGGLDDAWEHVPDTATTPNHVTIHAIRICVQIKIIVLISMILWSRRARQSMET